MPRFTGGSGRPAFLREILDHALDDLSQHSTERFDGRLECFRDVLVPDTTAVTLYRSLTDSFPSSSRDGRLWGVFIEKHDIFLVWVL